MTKEIIATGKTIELAIEAGCAQLGVERDCVSIEVLEAPSKSLFGLKTTDAKVKLTLDVSAADRAVNFLGDVLGKMGLAATITASQSEEGIFIDLEGPDMGIVIGRRGETLDALQYLTSLAVNREEEDYIKVTIDTENYRAKREETLVRLARKLASKAVKYHKNMTLEPMNPYERRIIHSTLQDFEGVTTYSVGSEPNRKVVIAVEGSEHTQQAPKQGGKSRGGRGGRGRGGRGRGRAHRETDGAPESAAPAAAEPAEQPTAHAALSDKELWSKISGRE